MTIGVYPFLRTQPKWPQASISRITAKRTSWDAYYSTSSSKTITSVTFNGMSLTIRIRGAANPEEERIEGNT